MDNIKKSLLNTNPVPVSYCSCYIGALDEKNLFLKGTEFFNCPYRIGALEGNLFLKT
jgi:hypothetical protein